MKKLMAMMCAVLLLGSLTSEAQARGNDRRRNNRGDERRIERRRDDGRRFHRYRGNQGRGRNIVRYPRPTRPNRPIMDRPARPVRQNDGYRRHVHRPHRNTRNYRRRYARPYDYYRTIPYRFVYRNRWIRFSVGLGNGFFAIDGYPYYMYNGYRHRYSYHDTCDYDLVDSYNDSVTQRFYGYTCAEGYDDCADLRDDFNYDYRGNRYFCAERANY